MKAAISAASSPSSSLIFSTACVVFSLDASSRRKAFSRVRSRSGEKPRRAESDFVDAEGLVLAVRRSQREGQHVLRHNGSAADEGVRAHGAELMDRAECADGGIVLDDDMTGQRGAVGQDAMAAHLAVVADVRVGHQQIAGAQTRYAVARRLCRG